MTSPEEPSAKRSTAAGVDAPSGAVADHVALDKHACAACGAEAEWQAARQSLVCTHCGTVAPMIVDSASGAVEELDLVRALRELPDTDRGWQAERRAVRCRSCNAVSVFEPARVGQSCEFCGSTELVGYDEIKAPIRPRGVVPFKIDVEVARESLRGWLRSRWFAPRALKRAVADRVHGVYLPYWTFDAHAFCHWTAESGTYYYTSERARDHMGRMRTRQVRHVRWRPVRGVVEHVFDDFLIPASHGVEHQLLRTLEPFPTQQASPYHTGYLAGFMVEHYQVVLFEAFNQARAGMVVELQQLAARDVPGDTHRNLEVQPEFSGQTFKHVLVPVWLAGYRWRGKPYQVLVNGATGRIAGRYPKSWIKILLALAAVGLAVAVAALLISQS